MVKKQDEIQLYTYLKSIDRISREAVYSTGIHRERAAYILYKWAEQGFLEYGISPFVGWFTEESPDTLDGM